MYGKKLSEETRAKMSASRNGMKRPKNPEMIGKQRESLKAFYKTKEGKELKKRLSVLNKGTSWHLGFRHEFSEEFKEKRSEFMKSVWNQSEEYKSKRVKKILQASNIRPTKPEIAVFNIVKELQPNYWKYTGDGKVVIGGKNPDIFNVNGEKKVILIHGIYWHLWKPQETNPSLTREKVEKKDMRHYKKYGYNALIIWEDELSDIEKVEQKIKEFISS